MGYPYNDSQISYYGPGVCVNCIEETIELRVATSTTFEGVSGVEELKCFASNLTTGIEQSRLLVAVMGLDYTFVDTIANFGWKK